MKHEQKECVRCFKNFECKAGDITNCQCYGIELSAKEEGYVRSKYDDCLCRNCLLQLKQHLHLFNEQNDINKNR
jgi:Cysteine-rich CWC